MMTNAVIIYLKLQFFLLWHQYDCPLDYTATSTMRRIVQFENSRISATSEKVIGNLIQKRNNLNLVWPKLALSLHSADFTWSEIMRKQITSLTNLKGTL